MENLDEVASWLERRGITKAIASSRGLGLVKQPILGHGPATNRLAIPYLTDAGPVAMNFRCVQDHDCKVIDNHSKYWKPKGSETRLYGVQSYFTDEMAINVAEGELDAIILSELAGLPAFGIPGSGNWQDQWSLVFKDFDHVLIWADGDPSGKKMFNKFAEKLGQRAKLVELPSGEDVNSLYLKYGAEYLKGLIPK